MDFSTGSAQSFPFILLLQLIPLFHNLRVSGSSPDPGGAFSQANSQAGYTEVGRRAALPSLLSPQVIFPNLLMLLEGYVQIVYQ